MRTISAMLLSFLANACSSLTGDVEMRQDTLSRFKSKKQEESPIYNLDFSSNFGVQICDSSKLDNMRMSFKKYLEVNLYKNEEGSVIYKARESFLGSFSNSDEDFVANLFRFAEKIRIDLTKPASKKQSMTDLFLCSNCTEKNLLSMPNFLVDVQEFFNERNVWNYSKYCPCIEQIKFYRKTDKQDLIRVPSFVLIDFELFGKINGGASLVTLDFLHEIYINHQTEDFKKALMYGLCSLIIERCTRDDKISNKAIDTMLGLEFSVLRSIYEYKDDALKSCLLYISTHSYETVSNYREADLEEAILSKKDTHPIYQKFIKGMCTLPEAHIMCEVFKLEKEIEGISEFCETFLQTEDKDLVKFHKLAFNYQKSNGTIRKSVVDLVKGSRLRHSLAAMLFAITDEALAEAISQVIRYNRDFMNEERLATILKLDRERAIMFIKSMDMERFPENMDRLNDGYIQALNEGTAYGVELFMKANRLVENWKDQTIRKECSRQRERVRIFNKVEKDSGKRVGKKKDNPSSEIESPARTSLESKRSSSRERRPKETSLSARTEKKPANYLINKTQCEPNRETDIANAYVPDISYEEYRKDHRGVVSEFYFPEVGERSRSKEQRPNCGQSFGNGRLSSVIPKTPSYTSFASTIERMPMERNFGRPNVRVEVPSYENGFVANANTPKSGVPRDKSNFYPTISGYSATDKRQILYTKLGDTAFRTRVAPPTQRPKSPVRITYSPLKDEIIWPHDMEQEDIDKIKRLYNVNKILCGLLPKHYRQLFFINLRERDYEAINKCLWQLDSDRKFGESISYFMSDLRQTSLSFNQPKQSQQFYERQVYM